MERKKRRRTVEALKDILLVLLAFSAIYLTLRSQIINLSAAERSGWLGSVLRFLKLEDSTTLADGLEPERETPDQMRPVRMAVRIGEVGRYGIQYDQDAVDALFDDVASLLGDSLGSASAPYMVSEETWRAALSKQSGIYFDFLGKIPLSALAVSLTAGEGNRALPEDPVRRLLLAEEEGGALRLYYSNETTGLYYACETAEALRGHLQTAVTGYSPNGAVFAYEGEYDALEPYVLVPSAALRPRLCQTDNPAARMGEKDRETLMEALRFHPQSSTSYRSGDRLVVNEWPDRLSLLDDGRIFYETAASDEPKYPVETENGVPTAASIAQVTGALVKDTMGAWCGEGRLYLREILQTGAGEWQAEYGYCVDGIAVELGKEEYAARFTIQGAQIVSFSLALRTYTQSQEQSILLPETQAAAAMGALGAEGRELLLAYEDAGGAAQTMTAGWIAQQRR